jgi:hypothetical protein
MEYTSLFPFFNICFTKLMSITRLRNSKSFFVAVKYFFFMARASSITRSKHEYGELCNLFSRWKRRKAHSLTQSINQSMAGISARWGWSCSNRYRPNYGRRLSPDVAYCAYLPAFCSSSTGPSTVPKNSHS